MWVSGPNARDWRSQNHSLEWMAATEHDTVTLTGASTSVKITPVRAKIAPVTNDFFSLLEVKPEIGRATVPDDHREGATPVVVIGHGLWQRAFGGNPKAIGSTVHINGQTFTVVGVMPGGFDFPEKTEVWMPQEIFPDHSTRSAHNFHVYGRLKPNVSLQAAQADMNTIASRLANEYVDDKDRGIRVVSLYDQIVGPVRPALLILLAAVGFVLLIACVNVANLQLARGSTRIREMALRAALGAGRVRLVRQLLTESLVIAIVGGSAGVLLAVWATEILRVSIPADIPRIGNVQVDATVLAFTLGLTLLA
jgi:putative ABC transport system permease protein